LNAPKRIVLLGPPGAGKGTQAKMLSQLRGLTHLSSGDILRDEIASGSDLGLKIKAIIDPGDLVPDPMILAMAQERIKLLEVSGFLLDGIPRTLEQAEALSKIVTLDKVLNIQISREKVVQRLTSRRNCTKCGKIYNILLHSLDDNSSCPDCGGSLKQRDDDQREVIERRFGIYERQTAPLVVYYHKKRLLFNIDGEGTIEEINKQIMDVLTK
jgi:adenylate kinase